MSPDGTRLATSKIDPRVAEGETGIWLLDLLRGVSTRLTFDLSPDSAPVWSPDGTRVAFNALRAGGYGIYQKATNGAGKEQELIRAIGDPKFPDDWSRDGRFLLYTQLGSSNSWRFMGLASGGQWNTIWRRQTLCK